jgi:peptidoglycan/xylan/chitin deacetylase (PgdA/CDA1 family)
MSFLNIPSSGGIVSVMKTISTLLFILLVTNVSYSDDIVHILGYHSFINGHRSKYDFSIDELRTQIRYFIKRGYRFVSFSDIIDGKINGRKNILITIDDGNRSIYRAYHEILRPLNIKPLLAIYPSIIGRRYALSWNQLEELSSDGCEIASHGLYHRKMSQRLYQVNKKSYLNEIYKSKSILERGLKNRIRVFVYPYGLYINEVFRYLEKAGYEYALTVRDDSLTLPISRLENPYEIPRYVITRPDKKFAFSIITRNAEGLYRISSRERDGRRNRFYRKNAVAEKKSILVAKNREVDGNIVEAIAESGLKMSRSVPVVVEKHISMLQKKRLHSENTENPALMRDETTSRARGMKIFSYHIFDGMSLSWWRYRKGGEIHYRVKKKDYHLSKDVVKSRSRGHSKVTDTGRDWGSSKDRAFPVAYNKINKALDKVNIKRDQFREDGDHLMRNSVKKYHALFDMMREKTVDLIR